MWDRIGVVIRATEARRSYAERLLARVSKFAPHAVISWHRPGRTIPESYADALAMGTLFCGEWTLQFEDDVYLAPDFEVHAQRLFESTAQHANIGLVSFFTYGRVFGDEKLPAVPTLEVIRGSQFLMAQAFVLRSKDVEDHNQFMLDFTKTKPTATDHATGRWLGSRDLFFARAWPSIVQHIPIPSLSGHTQDLSSQSFEKAYGPVPSASNPGQVHYR